MEKSEKSFDEKLVNFLMKNFVGGKTPLEELPVLLEYGSSSHDPENEHGVGLCDLKLWCKFADWGWFKPVGGFEVGQILGMLELCSSDVQVMYLMGFFHGGKDF